MPVVPVSGPQAVGNSGLTPNQQQTIQMAVSDVRSQATLFACAFEWFLCLCFFLWCVFCCHVIIEDSIARNQLGQKVRELNNNMFRGQPVLSEMGGIVYCNSELAFEVNSTTTVGVVAVAPAYPPGVNSGPAQVGFAQPPPSQGGQATAVHTAPVDTPAVAVSVGGTGTGGYAAVASNEPEYPPSKDPGAPSSSNAV